ncbi:HlyD family type I secretion periplasmic adaptor subunit [Roseitranquillus sediminis]|uniref:HlyD family type I secretion periplasmic adaptor subunit n=1 Tax=Roseitranquillus sediminis TaxID=2809051 RepID=UPI001D0C1E97|nr:HlyD family type I secretion periplasmic adaptor subunit [Roseitranquillus sediminis]MBM9595873.1 HlyD family type I secretion periplasmic adaptor subunit [Roseitranquillus sediminis]
MSRQMRRINWSVKVPVLLGLAALIVLVGGLGVWSVQARIAGAVIATGMVEVESNRQVVQHPEGGVVGEILARDGDRVEAGEVVLKFDDTLLRSELAVIDGQLHEIAARRARLVAERDASDEIDFGEDLLELAETVPAVAEQVEGQRNLFHARRDTVARETEQLAEQRREIDNEIRGIEAQLAGLRTQQELVASERADSEELLEKGLIQLSRVSSLRREDARLTGEIGKLEADIARSRGRISGLTIEELKLETTRREEAITTLRDLDFRQIELAEQRLSLRERLMRMEVRAPVSGVIYGSRVFALQSVVQPAEPIMFVIAQDQPLVVASKVEPVNVDQVYQGQDVRLRFTAFDQRWTPEIMGKVTRVSADVIEDEATGAPYFRVEVLPAEDETAKLEGQTLLPGMPVETYFQTGDRTPLAYLTKPLMDYFRRAMRGD